MCKFKRLRSWSSQLWNHLTKYLTKLYVGYYLRANGLGLRISIDQLFSTNEFLLDVLGLPNGLQAGGSNTKYFWQRCSGMSEADVSAWRNFVIDWCFGFETRKDINSAFNGSESTIYVLLHVNMCEFYLRDWRLSQCFQSYEWAIAFWFLYMVLRGICSRFEIEQFMSTGSCLFLQVLWQHLDNKMINSTHVDKYLLLIMFTSCILKSTLW